MIPKENALATTALVQEYNALAAVTLSSRVPLSWGSPKGCATLLVEGGSKSDLLISRALMPFRRVGPSECRLNSDHAEKFETRPGLKVWPGLVLPLALSPSDVPCGQYQWIHVAPHGVPHTSDFHFLRKPQACRDHPNFFQRYVV